MKNRMEHRERISKVRLPANRAFVVQFAAEPAKEDLFHGRAEHLASGQVVQFKSLDHLAEFVAEVLGRGA